jgi:hypothetical protein
MAEPIPPGGQYGQATWQDNVNNWRKVDGDWLQNRSILRFTDVAQRDSVLTAPAAGQVIFRADAAAVPADGLEVRVGTAWIPYRGLPQNLSKVTDSATQVVLAHKDAAGQGVVFNSTGGVGVNTDFTVRGGVLKVEASGVSIKTGAVTAKLTTDATYLLSDKPLSVSEIKLTGSATPVFDATGKQVKVGSLLVDTAATIPAITMSGTLGGGGYITGGKGLIGGVDLGNLNAGYVQATGLITSGGWFYGGSTSAVMRFRDPANGSAGGSYISVLDGGIYFDGGTTYLRNTVQIDNGTAPIRQVVWKTPGADAYLGPVIYQAADPGAANYPNGTLWIAP